METMLQDMTDGEISNRLIQLEKEMMGLLKMEKQNDLSIDEADNVQQNIYSTDQQMWECRRELQIRAHQGQDLRGVCLCGSYLDTDGRCTNPDCIW